MKGTQFNLAVYIILIPEVLALEIKRLDAILMGIINCSFLVIDYLCGPPFAIDEYIISKK